MSTVGSASAGPSSRFAGARIEPARFGVWLFLVTEAMFFAALIAAYLALRAGSPTFGSAGGALDVRLGGVATLMLVCASLCVSRAVVARRAGREARIVSSWTRRTLLFGALFLALQAAEYGTLLRHGLSPRTSLYWSCFFVLTSVHALHVLGGLAWLAVVWNGTRRRARGRSVELAALYWHLVDLVWLALFGLLYW
jgi:heme/copper-type cytochrome/quinol oxidase subunit 3